MKLLLYTGMLFLLLSTQSQCTKPDSPTEEEEPFTPEIQVLAGGTETGYRDGTGKDALLASPFGMCFDQDGNILFTELLNSVVRKVTKEGVVTTFAGITPYGFNDGPVATARFNSPGGICRDNGGNYYIADMGNQCIRKITPAGIVSNFSGSRIEGYGDGSATTAKFDFPVGICMDNNSNLYVTDQLNCMIRKVDPAGNVTTLVDKPDPLQPRLSYPTGIHFDQKGYLIIADYLANKLQKLTLDGTLSLIVGGSGDLAGFQDGPIATAKIRTPFWTCQGDDGDTYFVDRDNFRIRKIDKAGIISTVAGNGEDDFGEGPALETPVRSPVSVLYDGKGTLYVTNAFQILKIRVKK